MVAENDAPGAEFFAEIYEARSLITADEKLFEEAEPAAAVLLKRLFHGCLLSKRRSRSSDLIIP
jgi:hypothetical protein